MIEGPNLSDLKLDDTNYRACMQDTIQLIIKVFWMSINISSVVEFQRCTANVYRDLQGLGVLGFQIYGDCMYSRVWNRRRAGNNRRAWKFFQKE